MCSECRFLNGGIKMKPMNIKNVLSIGLLLSVFPTFSMITDGSELGRGLLADQETELPHISDHVAITIDGASSSTETSPAKSTDGLMSGEKVAAENCVSRFKIALTERLNSLSINQLKACGYISMAILEALLEVYVVYVNPTYGFSIAWFIGHCSAIISKDDPYQRKFLGGVSVGAIASILDGWVIKRDLLVPAAAAGYLLHSSILSLMEMVSKVKPDSMINEKDVELGHRNLRSNAADNV